MQSLYNAAMRIVEKCARLVWWPPVGNHLSHEGKAYQLIAGQRNILQHIRQEMADDKKEVYWVHAASLGEYGVARPILKKLQGENRCIVLTFFSPTGYQALHDRKDTGADHIFYLPWDTRQNASEFLDIMKPKRAVFIISEYWMNYLHQLGKRNIPTFVASALIPHDTYLKKWHAKSIRKSLKAITTFMVLNQESKDTLAEMGFHNSIIMGDPLFDNALSIAQSPYQNAIIERFCETASDGIFIAGSISDRNDLQLAAHIANIHPDVKCIFVPHEINSQTIQAIKESVQQPSVCYSEVTADTDFVTTQVLIIDYVGDLSRIYRYGRWAYVGGGFTPLLHSVIEPVVYGIPVAFGPRTHRKTTPLQMEALGIGKSVATAEELEQWFAALKNDENLQASISKKAKDYALSHAGATEAIVNTIINGTCHEE